MRTTRPNGGGSVLMDPIERGDQIRKRRLALGLMNPNQFAQAVRDTRDRDGNRLDRETLTKAERGEASAAKMDEIELWLARQEEEYGMDDAAPASAVKVTMRDVFGVGEMDLIFENGGDAEEIALYVGRIIDELKRRS